MCAGVGEREDEYVVFNIIEKDPIVFDMAVSKPREVSRKGVVFVSGRQRFASRKHGNDRVELFDVLAATKHLL